MPQDQPSKSNLFNEIATELSDPGQILEQIHIQKRAGQEPRPHHVDTTGLPETANGFMEPRTPTEKALTEIWAELLDRDQISIHDNFFDLGGHSLLATQLISRVRQVFQVEVPLTAILDTNYTVASMAWSIDKHQIEQAGAEAIAEALKEIDELSDDEIAALLTDS